MRLHPFLAVPVLSLAAASQGTLVIDLKPGGGFAGSGYWDPQAIALGDELLFAGDSGAGGALWITDGTAAGTRLVHDIHPGIGSYPSDFTPLGDEVVFLANDPTGLLSLQGEATLGSTVAIHLDGAPPSAPAVLFWSLDRVAQDLGAACTAYLAAPQSLVPHVTGATGAAVLAIAIPAAPFLLGLVSYLQDAIALPGGPLLGAAELSGGLEIVLGP